MSFLDNFFNAQKEGISKGWKTLRHREQLDEIIEDSYRKPVVIFKHSTRCGISSMAKHQLEADWDFRDNELDFYYLDLIAYRPVSNLVAEITGVTHQSPQIILMHRGKAVFDTSHHAISIPRLRKAMLETADKA